MCSFIPSLVEVEEEEDFIPKAGHLMRGGEGCRGGQKGGAGAKVCDDGVHPLVAGGEKRAGEGSRQSMMMNVERQRKNRKKQENN